MLYDPNKVERIYIACGYTDMRKQIDGLSSIVEFQYKKKMESGSLFLFCGRRADRIKALFWDGTGYVLLYKRLSDQRFQWPRSGKELKLISSQQFRWLMEGLSIEQKYVLKESSPVRLF